MTNSSHLDHDHIMLFICFWLKHPLLRTRLFCRKSNHVGIQNEVNRLRSWHCFYKERTDCGYYLVYKHIMLMKMNCWRWTRMTQFYVVGQTSNTSLCCKIFYLIKCIVMHIYSTENIFLQCFLKIASYQLCFISRKYCEEMFPRYLC